MGDPVKPDPLQLESLKRLRKYRDEPPGMRERVSMAVRLSIGVLVAFALLGGVFLWLGARGTLFLLAGILIGAAAREYAQQRRFVLWWPFSREITDWSKVDELLQASQPAPGAPPAAAAPAVRQLNWRQAARVAVVLAAVSVGGALAVERVLAFAHDPTRNNPPHGVIILTTSWCGYCRSLREHLTKLNVPYVDLDVENTTEGRYAYLAVRGTGVPITVVGDQVIRGIGREGMMWHGVDTALVGAGYTAPGARAGSAPQREGESLQSAVRGRLP